MKKKILTLLSVAIASAIVCNACVIPPRHHGGAQPAPAPQAQPKPAPNPGPGAGHNPGPAGQAGPRR